MVYSENQFGEMETPPVDGQTQSELNEDEFGHNTAAKAEQYRSDQIYPENRFGELGRADTFTDEHHHSRLSDKIKGMLYDYAR